MLNTKHTWNRWFVPKTNSPKTIITQYNSYGFTDLDDLEEIGRKELLSPCLIDAGIIHDVWCEPQAQFPRIGLQCKLLKEPKEL